MTAENNPAESITAVCAECGRAVTLEGDATADRQMLAAMARLVVCGDCAAARRRQGSRSPPRLPYRDD